MHKFIGEDIFTRKWQSKRERESASASERERKRERESARARERGARAHARDRDRERTTERENEGLLCRDVLRMHAFILEDVFAGKWCKYTHTHTHN